MTERPPRQGISRRGFVTGALGTGVAVGAGAALAGCSSPEPAAPPLPQAAFIPFEERNALINDVIVSGYANLKA